MAERNKQNKGPSVAKKRAAGTNNAARNQAAKKAKTRSGNVGKKPSPSPSPTPYRGAVPENSGTMKPRDRKPTPIKGGSGGNGTYKPAPGSGPKKRAVKSAAPSRPTAKRSAPKARPAARKTNRRSKK